MKPISYGKALCFALSPLMLSLSQAQSLPQQPPIIVTGNALRDADLTRPASVVNEDSLRLRAASSLGEALDGVSGVTSTYFGPVASRPNIRGQDGDRIRILNNSGASFDVSSLSFDHAVPVNPLALERIEVLRGPSTLLYGGAAIGGVINLIDRRLPRFDNNSVDGSVFRKVLNGASADRSINSAVSADIQNKGLAWHVDASTFNRKAMAVPVELPCEKTGELVLAKRMCNSQAKGSDFGLGGSLKLNNGYVGLSLSQFKSNYGSPAEDLVTLDMKSQRAAMEGTHKVDQTRGLQSVTWQIGRSIYKHTEFEGEEVGTVFKSKGVEARIEARYRVSENSQVLVGAQIENGRLEAIGEEAFLPPSTTKAIGAFVVQSWSQPWGKLNAGLRFDRVNVRSLDQEQVVERQFSPLNISFGAIVKMNKEWQATANINSGQRAPKDYELLANGPHVATNAFEIGDANLSKERHRSIEFGVRFKTPSQNVNLSAHSTTFKNYIALIQHPGLESDELPVFQYLAVPARFNGFEIEWTGQINNQWQLKMNADKTRATNRQSGQALPRIAPLRVGGALQWQPSEHWEFDLTAQYTAKPNDANSISSSYVMTGVSAQWNQKFGPAQLNFFVKVDNLTNRLAYSSTSILTQTEPGRVPLPGRNMQAGVQLQF